MNLSLFLIWNSKQVTRYWEHLWLLHFVNKCNNPTVLSLVSSIPDLCYTCLALIFLPSCSWAPRGSPEPLVSLSLQRLHLPCFFTVSCCNGKTGHYGNSYTTHPRLSGSGKRDCVERSSTTSTKAK